MLQTEDAPGLDDAGVGRRERSRRRTGGDGELKLPPNAQGGSVAATRSGSEAGKGHGWETITGDMSIIHDLV